MMINKNNTTGQISPVDNFNKFRYGDKVRIVRDEEYNNFYLGLHGVVREMMTGGSKYMEMLNKLRRPPVYPPTYYGIEIEGEAMRFYTNKDNLEKIED